GCVGACALGPLVLIEPEDVLYCHVKPEDAAAIVEEHLGAGRLVERLLWRDEQGEVKAHLHDIPFFRHQQKQVLHNCGRIDPENIDEYLERGGYSALRRVLTEWTPEQVIAAVTKSGLRGRGGAGFPTGRKWEFAAKEQRFPKYVVCNADEGDPGAFMDRSVLEGDPHAVIEGLAIAGYAIGAEQGFVYVRAEYPLALARLEVALRQARERGFLGQDICGSGFAFDLAIRVGAGAFVCGEETALLASVEGRRGMPRFRPPFPAQKGLWGQPTVINNVETLANIPLIIREGPEKFASLGTEGSKGTKVFALAGKINLTGLVEVPMGLTLRQIIYDIGGGTPGGKKFKAAQTGGPSGGCLPAAHLDTPVDYDSLSRLGAIMGSGGLIVMDEDTCMVDVARFFLQFTAEESCGKCSPCREGIPQMLAILDRIVQGNGREGDIEELERLGRFIKLTALCGLGQTAPNPVLSTLRYFRSEYEAHIYRKECPAAVCPSLTSFVIDETECMGCGACTRVCPAGAISGRPKEAHVIAQERCLRCGRCRSICAFSAVRQIPGRLTARPNHAAGEVAAVPAGGN
ncbi:MAG TPA: NADH-quinone oxidoreductase subunit NuoF, partial [Firmicutes bacterium]|nr:NADH-quinone oxidoreductase subunit NuoF [Bacillota bacterium]